MGSMPGHKAYCPDQTCNRFAVVVGLAVPIFGPAHLTGQFIVVRDPMRRGHCIALPSLAQTRKPQLLQVLMQLRKSDWSNGL